MMPGLLRDIRQRPGAAAGRVLAGAALAFLLATAVSATELPEVTLSLNGQRLTVEVANTETARTQGLMHRRMLPESRGMLFVFREPALHGMWMVNTYIPLSVAFLDARGVIINIADMEPHTRMTHAATQPAKYALEVNRGWFARRGITPGTRVEGIEQAPTAR